MTVALYYMGKIHEWDGFAPPFQVDGIIMVCFYHYARVAPVNPPPIGFFLGVIITKYW